MIAFKPYVGMATFWRSEWAERWAHLQGAPRSLRRRCLRSIALVSAVTWLVITAVLVFVAHHEAEVAFDRSLRELAHMALAFADHELDEINQAGGGRVSDDIDGAFSEKIVYQVWLPGGALGYRSVRAPEARPLTDGQLGFGELTLDGRELRTYTAWNRERSFQIQMGADIGQRETASWRLSAALCAGLLVAWAAFLALIRRQLNQALAPLGDAAQALSEKSVADLSPVSNATQVTELSPVIQAFNGLLARVNQALRHEQRFTSDAAHELRTPLAGLKVLVRNVRRARDPLERDAALAQMNLAIDRSTALINQLLALARYDRDPQSLDLAQPVDAVALSNEVMREVQPLAHTRCGKVCWLYTPQPVVLAGNADALAMALRNVLQNALLHSSIGCQVAVELRHEGAELLWSVHDSGPGIAPALRERVFARFQRLNRSGSPGAGLGLAIVRRVVELHQGTVSVGSSEALGGALLCMRLPMPPQKV